MGADLAEAGVGSYRFAVLVCDALANCQRVEGFSFGVDRAPPTITSASLPDRAINPTGDLSVSVADNLSGFGAEYLEASITWRNASGTTPECGPVIEGVDLAGRVVAGSCAPDTVGTLRTPRSTPGYYVYRIAPLDRAQNLGAGITRTVLVDGTPPSVTGLTAPARPTPGAEVTVGAEATDNLDLRSVSAYLVYPSPGGGRLSIPFAGPDSAGVPFDADLETRFTASVSFPFIATLTYPVGGRLAGASAFAADSVRVRALDVAGLSADQGQALTATAAGATPFASLDSVAVSLSGQNVCTARCLETDPTSVTVTARVRGPTGSRNPFAEGGRVYFFSRDPGGVVTLLGSTTSAPMTETGEGRTFSYSIPVRPRAAEEGERAVFAVGASVGGSGLLLGETRLRLFVR